MSLVFDVVYLFDIPYSKCAMEVLRYRGRQAGQRTLEWTPNFHSDLLCDLRESSDSLLMLALFFFFDEDKFLWFFRRVLYGQMNLGRTIPMKHILRDEISREAPNPRGFGGWSLVPFPPYKYSQAFKHTGAGGLCQLISREKEQFENLRTF